MCEGDRDSLLTLLIVFGQETHSVVALEEGNTIKMATFSRAVEGTGIQPVIASGHSKAGDIISF